MKQIIFALFLIFFSSAIQAAEKYGPYNADVIRVIDGDSILVHVHIFPNTISVISVRVNGVDTPELRGKCTSEKNLAIKARKFTQNFVGERVKLKRVFTGKFAGRIVADVETMDGERLNDALIQNGLGRPYNGGKRQSWCN